MKITPLRRLLANIRCWKARLRGLKDQLHLNGNEKFDQNMQDQLAVVLMKRRGLNDFMSGQMSEDKFMSNLSKEWASLPKDMSRTRVL